jgi:hypothetical protein
LLEEERIARAEDTAMAIAARQRLEIYTRGYTSEELAQSLAHEAASRQDKIDELNAELDKVDPARRKARAAEERRIGRMAETDRLLRQARESSQDPLMRRMVAEFDQRQAARQSAIRRSQADQLERAIASGDHATIRRVCVGAGFTVY